MAFAIFLSMLPISATASQRQPTLLAELEEESIPAQDLPASSPAESPSPNAAPSPAADTNPNSGEWIAAPAGEPTTAEGQAPIPNPSPSSQPSAAAPAEIAPAIDVGSIATTPQISDSSLAPLIDTAPTPARAASLRITEQQRVELEQGHTDDAIRELAHAISIDPSNSYAYFYLGRAYVARKDYTQAQTFFKRAEIGLASNSAWLGEIYAFEGLSLEQSGKSAEAAAAYQKALTASPGNLTARVGVTRVSGSAPADANAAPPPELDQPAPAERGVAPPPDEAPAPPPPPASAPVPED
ncbi:MAG TPA: tetratricopeptide repeat protein [Candidatus Binataceae bacterium]|nr:tetratricopeptide repeat protein [Candidatus Binataceae bacterium]